MARSFHKLLGGSLAAAAALSLLGCGARSVMELSSYRDAGFVDPDDGGTDGPIVDGPVYDHINDVKSCNPDTCGGCCDELGNCRIGLDTNACGIGGYQCVNCQLYGASCNAGTHQCGPAQECNPSTCGNGCCTSDGVCVAGYEPWACGFGGESCSDCTVSGATCDGDTRSCATSACGPYTCPGCCTSWGSCEWGGDAWACGIGGQSCADCSVTGSQCNPYSYQCEGSISCGPSTCPSGCCDMASGQCMEGWDPWACGTGGQVCQECSGSYQECMPSAQGGGVCQPINSDCGPWSCGGCCECSGGSCKCLEGYDSYACGFGGQTCQYCADPNMVCEPTWGGGGQCVFQPPQDCGPWNCGGCCDHSIYPAQCVWGGDTWACGGGGEACAYCDPGEQCEMSPYGGQCTETPTDCGPWNCGGCCDYNTYPPQCVWGGDSWACGGSGEACYSCNPGEKCEMTPYGGQCTGSSSDCGPWNCAGCCNYSAWPPFCDSGTNSWACGTQGQQCNPCPMGIPCTSLSSGGGICASTIPDAGPDGPPPPWDAGGCGPWNCQGCCTGAGNCVPGMSNQRCGAGGEKCENCSMQNLTCVAGDCT